MVVVVVVGVGAGAGVGKGSSSRRRSSTCMSERNENSLGLGMYVSLPASKQPQEGMSTIRVCLHIQAQCQAVRCLSLSTSLVAHFTKPEIPNAKPPTSDSSCFGKREFSAESCPHIRHAPKLGPALEHPATLVSDSHQP